ncbi:MAG TPA: NAD(P)H-dependent oxidoreductase subunit E, partial [Luteimonas sp.]|nr:NAD(P)H-dependent oxidoreductase subunit E [Luteimonas sp.]
MKVTGNFENTRNVDPGQVLSDATRAHIDHWLAKFPADRKRSAVLQGLHAAQEQNGGWLSDELVAAVAAYIGIPPVWAYEVASFYSMFETEKVGRNNVAFCTNISCWLNGAEELVAHAEKKLHDAATHLCQPNHAAVAAAMARQTLSTIPAHRDRLRDGVGR